jgi:hypothetical protein
LDILNNQLPDVIILDDDANGWRFCHIRKIKKTNDCNAAKSSSIGKE